MKKYVIFGSLVLLTVFSCKRAAENSEREGEALNVILRSPVNLDGTIDSTYLAFMEFEEDTWQFDTILSGSVVTKSFNFTNVGDIDLQISKVETTCGCTVPEYEEGPIAPGATSTITVTYDSTDKSGDQNKTITIYANTYPNKTVLRLIGYVK